MTVPEYYIIGSETGTGDLDMLDGPAIKVVGVRLVLKPRDKDDDETFAFVGILGREDVDLLVDKLVVAAAQVPYVQEQFEEVVEEKEGDSNS